MRIALFGLILSLITVNAQGLTVSLDPKGLKQDQIAPVQAFIMQAEGMLPPSFKDRLNKDIVVSFATLSELGRTYVRTKNVYLSSALLPHILAGPSKALPNKILSNHHETFYDVALGTLLHEISHQYDYASIDSPESKERKECLAIKHDTLRAAGLDKGPRTSKLPEKCAWKVHRQNISDNPLWIYALSWGEKEIKNQVIKADDQVHRSPNPYEFTSKAEAFSVNFEFFLMDPEYKCRRPTAFNFLKAHFEFDPFPEASCQAGNQVVVNLSTAIKNYLNFETIDISKVYQVHYLLAGDGQAMMSSWGHSMLRLVICAPQRKEVGPDCMNDIAYHRVVSYRAGVSDLAIDSLKGLTGGYASHIFMLPLLNVINEYTKLELRDLYSYPLNLNRLELNDFVTRVIEQFWSYRGKYYFVTNNCAVETFNLLKNIRPTDSQFANAKTITPKGVRDLIIRHGFSRNLTAQDFAAKTYFWPSKAGKYMYQLKEINTIAGTSIPTVQDFFDQAAQEDRRIFEVLKREKKGLSSFLVLSMVKLEKMVSHKNMVILDHESKSENSELYKMMQQKAKDAFAVVGKYYRGGYGIPNEQEVILSKKLMAEQEASQAAIENQKAFEQEVARVDALSEQLLGREYVADLKLLEAMAKEAVTEIKLNRNRK